MIKMMGLMLDAKGNEILMTHVSLKKMCTEVEKHFGVPNFIHKKEKDDKNENEIRMYYNKFTLIYQIDRKTLVKVRSW